MLSILLQIETVPATGSNAVDFTWLFIKMLLVLGIVSVFAVLMLKYVTPRVGLLKRFQNDKYFRVLGRYMLEPRKSLFMVETGGRYLVIGTSDHGISLITELSKEEAVGDPSD